jgi:hypothetical protein
MMRTHYLKDALATACCFAARLPTLFGRLNSIATANRPETECRVRKDAMKQSHERTHRMKTIL